MEKSLGKFVDERKAKQLKEKSLPVEGCAVVAGRTDKGVTALQQVCSFCQLKVIIFPFCVLLSIPPMPYSTFFKKYLVLLLCYFMG